MLIKKINHVLLGFKLKKNLGRLGCDVKRRKSETGNVK